MNVETLRKQLVTLSAAAERLAAAEEEETGEDPVAWAEHISRLTLDSWQRDVLTSSEARLGLLCCRQSGKSTITSLLAAHTVMRGGLAVCISPSQRQSTLLYAKIRRSVADAGVPFSRSTAVELETASGGCAISLPGDRHDLVRGLSLRWPSTSLLLVDECSRVRDSIWATISPMLAAAPAARQVLLSTPAGPSGEFHRIMTARETAEDWRRIVVTAADCPRISPAFLTREKTRLGESLWRQEYFCDWISSASSVFSADVLASMFGDLAPAPDDRSDGEPSRGNEATRFLF